MKSDYMISVDEYYLVEHGEEEIQQINNKKTSEICERLIKSLRSKENKDI